MHIYLFVSNSPTIAIDYLGQVFLGPMPGTGVPYKPRKPKPSLPSTPKTPSKKITCGKNVSLKVHRLLGNVRNTFLHKWSLWERCRACAVIDGYFNWDIDPLWTDGYPSPKDYMTKASTANTATFGGNCYYGGSVNYLLFGTIYRLCADFHSYMPETFFRTQITTQISLYKKAMHLRKPPGKKLAREIESQAKAMALSAFDGKDPSHTRLKNYKPRNKPRNSPFRWRWSPVKKSFAP